METTELYVEYIIIGMETLLWILMGIFIIIGASFKTTLEYCMTNILPTIIIIGVCYILGLVTDRIADIALEKRKNKFKNKYIIKSKTSIIVWEKHNNSTYAKFTLSRIRILRSTIFNSIIIGILGTYLAYTYYNIVFALFIMFLSITIFLGSNSTHKNLLDNYYKKTSALDNEDSKNITIPKKKKKK